MPKHAARPRSVFLGGLLFSVWLCAAADSDLPRVSISGFGTVGAVFNDSRGADFIRDLSQAPGVGYRGRIDYGVDSRIGIQLNARATDTLDGALQAVSRRRYDGSFTPELHWAYAKYSPSEAMQLRVGRLGPDLYMLADSRHIGYSYVMARPPVEYFGALPISFLDGADLVLTTPVAGGIARAKLFAGVAKEKMASTDSIYDVSGSKGGGLHGEFQRDEFLFRVGYARMRLENELPKIQPMLDALRSPFLSMFGPGPAEFADNASFVGKHIRYFSVGLVYDSGPFQAQLVTNRLKSGTSAYKSNDAGYLTLSYRYKEWVPYFAYAVVKSKDRPRDAGLPAGVDPALDALIAGAQRLEAESGIGQHTVSVGVRYDFMRNADIKVQVDRVHARRPFYWQNVQPGWNGRATMLSVTLDFVF